MTFALDKRSFAYWSTELHDWFVESGEFVIEVGRSSRDIVLTHALQVKGTVTIRRRYTLNSIYMDIAADEAAMAKLAPVMASINSNLGTDSEGTEAAKEAISEEMNKAMFDYMPLRSMMSFGASDKRDMLLKLVEDLNRD